MEEVNKIGRHSSLKEADFKTKVDPLHSSTKIEKSQNVSESPQEIQNSFNALRQLKKINQYKEMLKGRLSVLQILQQKDESKAAVNKNKHKFYEQVTNEKQNRKHKKDQYNQLMNEQLAHSQERANNQRKTHQNNLINARKQLSKSRNKDYRFTKEKRQQIERAISQAKLKQLELKRGRSLQIKEEEKIQRNMVQKFMKRKKNNLKKSDNEIVKEALKITEERQKQIEDLSRLQQAMLEKQAHSRMAKNKSETKLNKLMHGNISTSTSTTKLPLIHPQHQIDA